MIDAFLKVMPQYKESIVFSNLATPLTYEKYMNRFSAYGIDVTKDRLHD
jgi:hypothetical protein